MTANNVARYPQSGAMVRIQNQVASGSESVITFSDIPQTYTNLQLVLNVSQVSGSSVELSANFNGDDSTNYAYQLIYGNNESAIVVANTGQTAANFGNVSVTGTAGTITVDIAGYTSGLPKSSIAHSVSATGSGAMLAIFATSLWTGTDAITEITLSIGEDFTAGSTFSLYGLQ